MCPPSMTSLRYTIAVTVRCESAQATQRCKKKLRTFPRLAARPIVVVLYIALRHRVSHDLKRLGCDERDRRRIVRYAIDDVQQRLRFADDLSHACLDEGDQWVTCLRESRNQYKL